MALSITTADQRMAQKSSVKMVVFGPSGIGKTSLLWTLPAETTLFVDMEAGMLAVEGWTGDSVCVRDEATKLGCTPWEFLKHLGCLIAGPSPAVTDPNKSFSKDHYAWVEQTLGAREAVLGKYDTLFFDSITETGRYSYSWSKKQPEAFSEKTGKPDPRGAYGLHGQELVGGDGLFNHLKHCADKNIILVGILEQVEDDYGRKSWKPQIDGGKAVRELPGIIDEVISMIQIDQPGTEPYRAFVTHTINPFGVPAKDRSGRLEMIEEPHLGKLLEKMTGARREFQMRHAIPRQDETALWAQYSTGPAAANYTQPVQVEQQS